MAAVTRSRSIAGGLFGRLSSAIRRLRHASDIRGRSAARIDAIAHDLRVSRAELEILVAHGRQGAEEMPQLLEALGIDDVAIARQEPGVLRDMTLVCALCVAKSRCRRELEAGTAALHHRQFCANSRIIGALKKRPAPDSVEFLRGPSCC
jgi:hypothetical protein